jgi:putative ABC transport system substrate-binding protein
MRRREFMVGLGALAASTAAHGQQEALPVIGFVNSASPGPFAHLAAGFRKGLAEEGFEEHRNVSVEWRWAEGRYDRIPLLTQELIQRKVAVLAATGGAMAGMAAKGATQSIPIVFVMGGDPVRLGLVDSLSRPSGNVTGVTQLTIELAAKRLGLLHELVPHMKKMGVLLNPDFPDAAPQLKEVETASARAKLQPIIANASKEDDFGPALEALVQQGAEALLVGADPFFNSRREQLIGQVRSRGIPTIYEFREFAEAGGLISYGTDLVDAYRLGGVYVGRVLKGSRPAHLPVVQAAKFELIINLKTASALGITIPPTLLARADEVIE